MTSIFVLIFWSPTRGQQPREAIVPDLSVVVAEGSRGTTLNCKFNEYAAGGGGGSGSGSSGGGGGAPAAAVLWLKLSGGNADVLFVNDVPYGLTEAQASRFTAEVDSFDGVATLKILRPRLEDGGRYKCVVGQSNEAILSLTVIAPPDCSHTGKETIREGEDLSLLCSVKSRGSDDKDDWPTIYWEHAGNVNKGFTNTNQESGISDQFKHFNHFRIRVYREDNGRQVFCKATHDNILGEGSSLQCATRLDVQYLKGVTVYPNINTVRIGSAATFTCHPVGNPIPSLTWFYNGNQVFAKDTRFNLTEEGATLTVVEADEDANITCRGLNVIGFTNVTSRLRVTIMSPHVDATPTTIAGIVVGLIALVVVVVVAAFLYVYFRTRGRSGDGEDDEDSDKRFYPIETYPLKPPSSGEDGRPDPEDAESHAMLNGDVGGAVSETPSKPAPLETPVAGADHAAPDVDAPDGRPFKPPVPPKPNGVVIAAVLPRRPAPPPPPIPPPAPSCPSSLPSISESPSPQPSSVNSSANNLVPDAGLGSRPSVVTPVSSATPTSSLRCQPTPPPISNPDLQTIREIFAICEINLGRDIEPLAEALDISYEVLKSAFEDHGNEPVVAIRRVLDSWADDSKTEATVDKLLEALFEIGREDIVLLIQDQRLIRPQSLAPIPSTLSNVGLRDIALRIRPETIKGVAKLLEVSDFDLRRIENDFEDGVNRCYMTLITWRNRNVISKPDALDELIDVLDRSGNAHVLRADSLEEVLADVHVPSAAGTPV